MLEVSKENNLENINDKNSKLKQNLLSEYVNNSNKKNLEKFLTSLPKAGNEETAFTENIEEEMQINDYIPLIENKNTLINKNDNKTNDKKKSKKIEVNIHLSEEDNKNNLTNITIPEFNNSNLNRNYFQNIIEENNKEIGKKIRQKNNIIIFKLKIILEIFLGIFLSISSIIILFLKILLLTKNL